MFEYYFHIIFHMKKESKSTQTNAFFFDQNETVFQRLDDGTIIYYPCDDKFMQDYMNSYDKWKTDGERFLKDKFVNEYIKTGIIPVLGDGRPEIEDWFNYTIKSSIFWPYWEGSEIFCVQFTDELMNIYGQNGDIPEYIRSQVEKVNQIYECLKDFD